MPSVPRSCSHTAFKSIRLAHRQERFDLMTKCQLDNLPATTLSRVDTTRCTGIDD